MYKSSLSNNINSQDVSNNVIHFKNKKEEAQLIMTKRINGKQYNLYNMDISHQKLCNFDDIVFFPIPRALEFTFVLKNRNNIICDCHMEECEDCNFSYNELHSHHIEDDELSNHHYNTEEYYDYDIVDISDDELN
jgi:hypothetical protein